MEKVAMEGISQEALTSLASADFAGILQTGIKYADAVVRTETLQNDRFKDFLDEQTCTHINNDETGIHTYYNLYKKLKAYTD